MVEPSKDRAGFWGTYFDRDSVLRMEHWTRILAWAILAIYVLQAGYDAWTAIYNSIIGNYPVDWFYFFLTVARPLQGAMISAFLLLAGKALLILMDIEDNTRRAARQNGLREK
jgi:hypothetical protein